MPHPRPDRRETPTRRLGAPRAWVVAGVLALSAAGGQTARADCGPPAGDPHFLGDPRPCPPEPPGFPALRLDSEVLLGWQDAPDRLDHTAAGVALGAEVQLAGPLSFGARLGTLRGERQGAGDGRGGGTTRSLWALAGPRLVLHTEPARREAWRFEASAGYAEGTRGGARDGGVVEVAVGRQAGLLLVRPGNGHGTGHEVTLTLRYQQGLGDAREHRAVLLGASYAAELFTRLPGGPEPPRRRPRVEHRFGGGGIFGARFAEQGGLAGGAGVWASVPLGRVVELTARTDALRISREQADSTVLLSFLGGVKIPRWFLAYGEVLAGYSVPMGPTPQPVEGGAVIEIGAGFQMPNMLGCGIGIRARPGVRFGVSDGNRDLVMLLTEVSLTYDSLVRARECWP